MIDIILGALEQSALFFPLAFGVYLSYVILNTTDMTTEGSFVLGGGVFARLLSLDVNIVFCAIASLISGLLAGCGVSFIQAKDKINSLVAGIIALFLLYTLNFKIMGRPNIATPSLEYFNIPKYWIFSVIVGISFLLIALIATRLGLILRAFGRNSALLQQLGIPLEKFRMLGLGLSNLLAAFCGVISVMIYGFADLGMGFGVTLTGISTVMIGQQLQKRLFPNSRFNIFLEIIACFLGVLLYYLSMNCLLAFGLDPIYLKFALGILLIFLFRRR